jgi:hypothetical protein
MKSLSKNKGNAAARIRIKGSIAEADSRAASKPAKPMRANRTNPANPPKCTQELPA